MYASHLKTGIMADRINHQGFEKALGSLVESDWPDFFIETMVRSNEL